MVLSSLGRDVSSDAVREAVGVSQRDGADAQMLLRGAESFGLRGRGVTLDVSDLHFLPPGSILHWEFNHFVVFERFVKRGARVVDPAYGPRIVPLAALRRSFTGVALVFQETAAFERKRAEHGRLGWYLAQLSTQRHVLTRVVVMSLLLRVFALAVPLLTAVVVDRVVPRADMQLLFVVAIGLAGLLAFQTITSLVRSHLLLQLRTNLDSGLTLGFVDYLLRLPYEFFQRRSPGDLLMRVNSNSTVRELLTANTLSAILDGLFVVGYGALLVLIAPVLGAIVVAVAVAQVSIFVVGRRRYRELMARSIEAQSRSQSYLMEMLSGIETLRAAAAESQSLEQWGNLYVDEVNASLDRSRLQAALDAAGGVLVGASPFIVLVLGAAQVARGELSLGQMLAANALAIAMLSPIATMVASAFQLQLIGSYMDKIDDVLRTKPEQNVVERTRAPKLSGRITLQDVSFRYSETSPYALRNISLDIRSGTTIAVVGSSGCGKSTLARIIAGLYIPSDGKVLFDGYDVTRLELKSLRQQIGVVLQGPSLFAGTVRSALALCKRNATLAELEAASRIAAIHDDVMAMPMGYDTLLAHGGSSLSGGQRQRIALARALVHQPAILVLDEATSALDAITERRVIENLAKLRCTQIVLAHRLSTIVRADTILVMRDGEIVEHGTHEQLLSRGQYYTELLAAQLDSDFQRGAA
jgi:ABC-type bacteriocin/lantibiotic exporter with double-glycine peptidase domain